MADTKSTAERSKREDHGLTDELAGLKEDMRRLREDFMSLGQKLLNVSAAELHHARDRISQGASDGVDALRERVDSARETGREAADRLQEKIEERPLLTMLIAFVVGLFFGKMMNRR